MDIKDLELRLNNFDPAVRKAALQEAKAAFENGAIEVTVFSLTTATAIHQAT